MNVLVADTLEPEVLNWLAARHTLRSEPELARQPEAFRQALAQARAVVIPASVPIDAASLKKAPELRAIARLSGSSDNLDLAACAAAGVEVVRPTAAGMVAEAEFAIGALLQMLRRVPVISPEGLLVGRELNGATVGIIGMTPTARPLAELLRAFGARVVGYDPGLHASDALWTRWDIAPVGLRELIAQCDAVVVLLAYFSRYRGLLGERYLAEGRPDQVMVNLSNALIFDEAALAEALTTGRMAAAWLDNVDPGLTAAGRPLANIDSLQVTPRVASTTRESHLRASWAVARRLDELLTQSSPLRREPPPLKVRPLPPDARADLAGGPMPG
jgi:D-3-phosphoglycerate dehydrogenase / 2-oxoglutarate reductase